MLIERKGQDKWAQIVGSLAKFDKADDGPQTSRRDRKSVRASSAAANGRGHARIAVLERPTSTSATIEWRDSTMCRYGAQLWRLMRARKPGICALSGEPIYVGDEIFKPCGRTLAANADAMIRTAALGAAVCGAALND